MHRTGIHNILIVLLFFQWACSGGKSVTDAGKQDTAEDKTDVQIFKDIVIDTQWETANDTVKDIQIDIPVDVPKEIITDVPPDVKPDIVYDVQPDLVPDTPKDLSEIYPDVIQDIIPENPAELPPEIEQETGKDTVLPDPVQDISQDEDIVPETEPETAPETQEDAVADVFAEITETSEDSETVSPVGDEFQVLLFINSKETTYSVLRYDVGLTSKAVINLLEKRDGDDGIFGTSDDSPYKSISDIDAVPEIGEKSLEKIIHYAINWQEGIIDPMLDFLNDPDIDKKTLDETVGLTSKAAENIALVKSGHDGIYGNEDDVSFHSRGEIDAIPYVGTWTIKTIEKYINVGFIEELSTITTSHLMSVTFFVDGTALIVGVPVGIEPHVILYNPFSEEAYTTEDETYQIANLSENVKTSLYSAASDPSMETGLTGGEGSEIYRYDAWMGSFVPVDMPSPGMYHSFVFSPDGAYALFLDMGSDIIWSYDAAMNDASVWGSAQINHLAFTPSADVLLGTGDNGSIWTGNTDIWTEVKTKATEDLFDVIPVPGLSEYLFFGDMGAGLKGDFTQTDNMTRLPTKTIKGFKCAAFSPDGSHALVVGEHGAVLKFDPVSGHFIPLTSGATKNLEAVAFSPDGKEAIIVGEGGTILKYTPPVQ